MTMQSFNTRETRQVIINRKAVDYNLKHKTKYPTFIVIDKGVWKEFHQVVFTGGLLEFDASRKLPSAYFFETDKLIDGHLDDSAEPSFLNRKTWLSRFADRIFGVHPFFKLIRFAFAKDLITKFANVVKDPIPDIRPLGWSSKEEFGKSLGNIRIRKFPITAQDQLPWTIYDYAGRVYFANDNYIEKKESQYTIDIAHARKFSSYFEASRFLVRDGYDTPPIIDVKQEVPNIDGRYWFVIDKNTGKMTVSGIGNVQFPTREAALQAISDAGYESYEKVESQPVKRTDSIRVCNSNDVWIIRNGADYLTTGDEAKYMATFGANPYWSTYANASKFKSREEVDLHLISMGLPKSPHVVIRKESSSVTPWAAVDSVTSKFVDGVGDKLFATYEEAAEAVVKAGYSRPNTKVEFTQAKYPKGHKLHEKWYITRLSGNRANMAHDGKWVLTSEDSRHADLDKFYWNSKFDAMNAFLDAGYVLPKEHLDVRKKFEEQVQEVERQAYSQIARALFEIEDTVKGYTENGQSHLAYLPKSAPKPDKSVLTICCDTNRCEHKFYLQQTDNKLFFAGNHCWTSDIKRIYYFFTEGDAASFAKSIGFYYFSEKAIDRPLFMQQRFVLARKLNHNDPASIKITYKKGTSQKSISDCLVRKAANYQINGQDFDLNCDDWHMIDWKTANLTYQAFMHGHGNTSGPAYKIVHVTLHPGNYEFYEDNGLQFRKSPPPEVVVDYHPPHGWYAKEPLHGCYVKSDGTYHGRMQAVEDGGTYYKTFQQCSDSMVALGFQKPKEPNVQSYPDPEPIYSANNIGVEYSGATGWYIINSVLPANGDIRKDAKYLSEDGRWCNSMDGTVLSGTGGRYHKTYLEAAHLLAKLGYEEPDPKIGIFPAGDGTPKQCWLIKTTGRIGIAGANQIVCSNGMFHNNSPANATKHAHFSRKHAYDCLIALGYNPKWFSEPAGSEDKSQAIVITTNAAIVHYKVHGREYKLFSGGREYFSAHCGQDLTYQSGTETKKVNLKEGIYQFCPTPDGWNLLYCGDGKPISLVCVEGPVQFKLNNMPIQMKKGDVIKMPNDREWRATYSFEGSERKITISSGVHHVTLSFKGDVIIQTEEDAKEYAEMNARIAAAENTRAAVDQRAAVKERVVVISAPAELKSFSSISYFVNGDNFVISRGETRKHHLGLAECHVKFGTGKRDDNRGLVVMKELNNVMPGNYSFSEHAQDGLKLFLI